MERRRSSIRIGTSMLALAAILVPATTRGADLTHDDRRSVVAGFLAAAARLDAADLHAHLAGVMGIMSDDRRSGLFDFAMHGSVTGTAEAGGVNDHGAVNDRATVNGRDETLDPDDINDFDDVNDRDDERTLSSSGRDRRWRHRERRRHRSRARRSFSTHAGDGTAAPYRFDELPATSGSFDLASARHAAATALGLAETDAPRRRSLFNMWVTARGAPRFAGPSRSEISPPGGWAFSTGAHYQLAPRVTLGALFRTRAVTGTANALQASTDLRGFGVGLYSGIVVSPNVTVTTLAHYERGANDVTIAGARGQFGSDQLAVSATARGMWRWGNWWFSPAGGVNFARTASAGFSDSEGRGIAAAEVDSGQLSLSQQVGYVFFGDGKIRAIRPAVTLSAFYPLLETRDPVASHSGLMGPRGLHGQVTAGVDMWFGNEMTMAFDLGYGGIGARAFEAWTARGRVEIPFR